jgi:hypothetical protein
LELKELLPIDISKEKFDNPEKTRMLVQHLCNIIETLYIKLNKIEAENKQLKDEINKLKGEQGKPKFKPKTNPTPKNEHNQIKRIENKNEWKKSSKKENLKIDEVKEIKYEGLLPKDAINKGTRSVIIQDIIVKTNNIEYKLETYYSPSENKTYEAKLPDHINGEFGNELKSWVIVWYYHCQISETKIHQMLTDMGIIISEGTISNMLIKNHDNFHQEKLDIAKAGILSTPYQHTDSTGARDQGINKHFNVLCNDYYSVFVTSEKKDRMSIIKILNLDKEVCYLINDYTVNFLKEKKLPKEIISKLANFIENKELTETEFKTTLNKYFPNIKKKHKTLIMEAAAITSYQENNDIPVIQQLVCDDAKQYFYITKTRGLCWIHEERHYKKLIPFLPHHQTLLDDFREKIWDYYFQLKKYKMTPNEKDKKRLSDLFDEIFTTETGYGELDNRIKLTMAKKENLLLVLEYPEIPLHNNPAELALRKYVIKIKISFGTKTKEGASCWETFFSILDTCRKLGVNFRDYLYDRISNEYKMPSLASLIPVPT